ncbi:MAG TPA: hypothetical protein VMN39_09280 [Longimicrobiaceae bacterium]|nr:hypothetical protein [Longimicrobiaceae bacterium]
MSTPVVDLNVHRLRKHEAELEHLLVTLPKSSRMRRDARRMLRETRDLLKTHDLRAAEVQS